MAVRAKVRCNAKTSNEVHFNTVYEDKKDDDNARFTRATPWGDIKMGIDNPAAMAQFEVNKEYYVDFTPVGTVGTSMQDVQEAAERGAAGQRG